MPLAFPTGTSSHSKNTLQKRKFEFKVLLLLHVLIPGAMFSSPLDTINPWLSACDLKQQDLRQQDLKGSCAAPMQFPTSATSFPDAEVCPKECSPNESKTNASCLAYLDETRRNAICNFNLGNGIEWLKSFLGTIRLRHCCEYKIIESLSSSLLERVLRGKDECFRIIDSLVEVDNLASRVTCEFSEVLSRYDCGQPYSVKFSCNDCLEAYRRWVCSTLVPYYNESVRIRPCRSVCQAVEQKCPYFLPENKAPTLPTQYAGEPTFLCMDPHIPEVGEQQQKSLYPDDITCCVKICGSLKDGLCVGKSSQCKSEELIPYEEALDQTVECVPAELTGTRVPNLDCTASEPYSSPYKLGSGGPREAPWASLVLLSACLSQGLSTFLLVLLLHSCLPPISFYVLLCLHCLFLFPHPGDLTRTKLFLSRWKTKTKLIFHFVKRTPSLLHYLVFESNKWQYFFILISVNLSIGRSLKTPQPLKTPSCFSMKFANSKKTRRARRYYYYFYYLYYYKYRNVIIAQRSNFASNRKRFRDTKLELIDIVARHEIQFNSIKRYSLTINRSSHAYKLIIIARRSRGSSRGGRTEGVGAVLGSAASGRARAETFYVKQCSVTFR